MVACAGEAREITPQGSLVSQDLAELVSYKSVMDLKKKEQCRWQLRNNTRG